MKETDFQIPLRGLLFEQDRSHPSVVTVYGRQSERASKAMDVFLNGVIGPRIRHETSSITGTGMPVHNLHDTRAEQHYVAFNSCERDRSWNQSIRTASPKTRIKGDVLILPFDNDLHRIQSFTLPDMHHFLSLISALPLSFVFPSMKNCN